MLAWIEGQLLSVKPPVVVVNINGLGYELEVPMPTVYGLPNIGEKTTLFVHMVVREDAQLLYGFADQQGRDIFRQLLKISGVGPKVALAILSTFSARDFFDCIAHEQLSLLTAVPGIGKKTAERLMVEMKNRFAEQLSAPTTDESPAKSSQKQDAIDALQALGYKQKDAVQALKGLDAAQLSSEEMIKAALQVLSGRVL